MAEAHQRLMSVEEFFEWQLDQEERYELVDGVPVPLRGMTGASNFHDTTATNIIGLLWQQLRGSPCRVTTADTAVRTSIRQVRRADATVECAPPQANSYEAHAPRLLVEVVSPSNRPIDRIRKIEEYKRLPTLTGILFVEPSEPRAVLLTRQADGGWLDTPFQGLDAVVSLPDIGASLALRDIYEGVPLDPEG